MFNIFPELLSFHQVSPLILRLVVAFELAGFAYQTLFRNRAERAVFFESIVWAKKRAVVLTIGVVEFALAGLFFIGLLTQGAAIVSATLFFLAGLAETKANGQPTSRSSHLFVLTVIALSLIFTSAGFYSLDYPL